MSTREKYVVSPEDWADIFIENYGFQKKKPEWITHNKINNMHLESWLGEFLFHPTLKVQQTIFQVTYYSDFFLNQ